MPVTIKYPKEAFLLPAPDIICTGRARKDFRGIESLVESLRVKGLLHPPVVGQDEEGKWHLVAGERRLRSMLILGCTEIPVVTRDQLDALSRKELELEENLQRQSLDWQEQIENLRQIDEIKRKKYGEAMPGGGAKNETKWSTEKTGELIGLSRSATHNQVAFAKLMKSRPDLKEKVKGLPMTAAMRVASQTMESEKYSRMHKDGLVKLSHDLLLGNCLTLIKNVPSESVQLVLTDPPFGISEIADEVGSDQSAEGAVVSYTAQMKTNDNSTKEKVAALMVELIPELARVMKPSAHGYLFFSFELYEHLITLMKTAELEPSTQPLIWYKGRTTSPFRGYDYQPCYEPILFFHKPPVQRRLSSPGKTLLEYQIVPVKQRLHIFEKPAAMLQFLIKQSTYVGETVLDPFAGSGAVLRAAKSVGRTAVGFELDKEHFLKAQLALCQQKAGEASDSTDRPE